MTNLELVACAKSKLGMPYLYGAKDEIVTAQKYSDLKNAYGSMVWDSDKAKIGLRCVDCSGLTSSCTGIARGSQEYRDRAAKVYPISTIADAPIGALVWHVGHIGVYIGGGQYIAADGSQYGVRVGKLPASFTHWFLCVDVEYPVAGAVRPVDASGIKAGDIVRIKAGAVYGGLDAKHIGVIVPTSLIGRPMTVDKVETHGGVDEALLREVFSWVAVEWLEKVS